MLMLVFNVRKNIKSFLVVTWRSAKMQKLYIKAVYYIYDKNNKSI